MNDKLDLELIRAVGDLDRNTAYFVVDRDQRIRYWSPGAEQLLGHKAVDVVGEHCSKPVHCVTCAHGCGLKERGTITGNPMAHFAENGAEVQVVKQAQAIYDEDGRFLGGLEILRPMNQEAAPKKDTREPVRFHGILTQDPGFVQFLTGLRHVAQTEVNVLLRGESGTGKEVVARALHAMSKRSNKPFVAINCGTLSREFLISELFGHKKGSFTGASGDKQGMLAVARGGTLFLDEVAELPMDVQAMLLRVIQERKYRMLGDTRDQDADVRILSATHESLRDAVAAKQFREDLMFRLRVVPLFIPPLRDRGKDVFLLWDHFLDAAAKKHGLRKPRTSEATRHLLQQYPWPGNVRELMNLTEYVTVTRPGKALEPQHLLPEFRQEPDPQGSALTKHPGPERQTPSSGDNDRHQVPPAAAADAAQTSNGTPAWMPRHKRRLDRDTILAAMAAADGNLNEAAQRLGISRITLWRKRKELGIP